MWGVDSINFWWDEIKTPNPFAKEWQNWAPLWVPEELLASNQVLNDEVNKLQYTSQNNLKNMKEGQSFLDREPWKTMTLFYGNNPDTGGYAWDDWMTWYIWIQWKMWDTTCAIDSSIITDKANGIRADELQLWCSREVLQLWSGAIDIWVYAWWQIKNVWDHWWEYLQNKIHESRDLQKVNLEYIDSYTTWGIQWQIILDYNLVEWSLSLVSSGNFEWNLDDSGYAIGTVMIEWTMNQVKIFLGYQASLVKWGDNNAYSNTLWDGKWHTSFWWFSINTTENTSLGIQLSPASKHENGSYLLLSGTYRF